MMKNLYFIVVVPHRELRKKARNFSRDFAERFDSVRSYRNFPHITMLKPFELEKEKEDFLVKKFQNMHIQTPPFLQKLNGFGNFPNKNQPTIFIKLEGISEITELLNEVRVQFGTRPVKSFSPHLTVGYKDLSSDSFKIAWEEYQDKAFEDEFLVDKTCLFKHFGGKWNLLEIKYLT